MGGVQSEEMGNGDEVLRLGTGTWLVFVAGKTEAACAIAASRLATGGCAVHHLTSSRSERKQFRNFGSNRKLPDLSNITSESKETALMTKILQGKLHKSIIVDDHVQQLTL